jgi:hypothetical protein
MNSSELLQRYLLCGKYTRHFPRVQQQTEELRKRNRPVGRNFLFRRNQDAIVRAFAQRQSDSPLMVVPACGQKRVRKTTSWQQVLPTTFDPMPVLHSKFHVCAACAGSIGNGKRLRKLWYPPCYKLQTAKASQRWNSIRPICAVCQDSPIVGLLRLSEP